MRKLYEDKLIELIRSVVSCGGGEADVLRGIGADTEREFLEFAKRHQLDYLVAYAYYTAHDERYFNLFFNLLNFTEQQIHAAREVSEALEQAGIAHIPLKGAVIRALYPERWMRNSCDVDVLVKEDDLYKAKAVVEALGFEMRGDKTVHDITFYRGSVHLELHFQLIEDYRMKAPSKILLEIWDAALLSDGARYTYRLPDEYFYFYHIAHMAKHFGDGGCGIRPFMDLWVLNHRREFSREGRDALLARGELASFEAEMRKLSEHWFSDGDGTGLEFIERYILVGGAYGNVHLGREVKKTRGGRLKFFLSRVFLPYGPMSRKYKVLKKHPYLLPVFEVWRWIEAVFKDRKHFSAELKEGLSKPKNMDELDRTLARLGLESFK